MATFKAKYYGRCPRCIWGIIPGQLICKEVGKTARHVSCQASLGADLRQLGRQISMAQELAKWAQRNPAPALFAKVAKLGGPAEPQWDDFASGEEREWHHDRHEQAVRKWLVNFPSVMVEHEAACARWRTARAQVEEHLRKAGAK